MKIRGAKLEDLNELIRLYYDFFSYQSQFAKFVTDTKIKINKKELRKDIKKNLFKKNNLFLVAEEDNKIYGFVVAEIMSYEKSRTTKKVIEIVEVYNKNKREGFGKKFLTEVENWAKIKKAKWILWEFISGNKIAENFCIKNGFKKFKTKMLKKIK